MIRALVVVLAFSSLFARADSDVASSVNAWITQQARNFSESRGGVDGGFTWKTGSDGLIYSGSFSTRKSDFCAVSSFRASETETRLDYEMLLSCQNHDEPSMNGLKKMVRSFALTGPEGGPGNGNVHGCLSCPAGMHMPACCI